MVGALDKGPWIGVAEKQFRCLEPNVFNYTAYQCLRKGPPTVYSIHVLLIILRPLMAPYEPQQRTIHVSVIELS